MNHPKMQEGEYVETSDVEELDDVYEPVHAPVYENVHMDSAHGRGLISEENSREYGTPRKRRKLSHPVDEPRTGMQAGPSHGSTSILRVVGSQLADRKTQAQNDTNVPQMKDGGIDIGEKMDIGERLVPRPPPQTQELLEIDLTTGGTSALPDVKAQAPWTTPRKSANSRISYGSPLPQVSPQETSQQRPVPSDYEGDLLDQLEQSLSPQVFTPKLIPEQESPRTVQSARLPQDESDDELAIMPPKSTSPLPTSQVGCGTSEGNPARGGTPLSFPSSSPLSPVESEHSHAGDNATQTQRLTLREDVSPSRNSATDAADDYGISRYPLRRRQPNQLRPYLYDDYQYKTVLKHNPAAIIDVLRLQRRRPNQVEDRYDEGEDYVEDESQQQTGDTTTEVETQRERTKSPAEPLPAFLDPLTESEDESDGLAEEARRVERELRRRQKEERQKERHGQREEEERRKERLRLRKEKEATRKPKTFPMSNTPINSARPNSHASNDQSPPTNQQAHHSQTTSTPRSVRSPSAQPFSDHGINELDALRDYFTGEFSMSAGDVDMNTVEPEPPPDRHSSPQNTTPDVTEVDDDDSTQGSGSSSNTGSDQELSKRYRELFRLYPPNMARKLLEKDKSQHRSRRSESETTEDAPLLPGQSRIRRAANSMDIRDIRGDSESDESGSERRTKSPYQLYNGDIRDFLNYEAPASDLTWNTPSQAQKAGPSQPRTIRNTSAPPPDVIEVSDEETTSSSEEDQVNEEDINTLLGDDDAGIIYDTDTRHGFVKEESMIDWMLSRTRIVGSTISKPRAAGRKGRLTGQTGQSAGGTRPSRSKYKLDVTTRGVHAHGNERQTLLSFVNHSSSKRPHSKNDWPRTGAATEPIQVEVQDHGKRKSWKERRKERRERAKRQGVYSMANPHTAGITTGRPKKAVKVTIDLDDDDFYQSFAPRQISGTGRSDKGKDRADPLPPQFDNQTYRHQQPPETVDPQQRPPKRPRFRIGECTMDMRIETLQPGIVFSATSFIREGHLHTLLDTLTPNHVALRPDPTYLCGMNISPLMDLDAFLHNLNRIFDGLLGLTTDIPSDDYEEKVKDWTNLSRSAGRYITWFYSQDIGDSREQLSSFIKNKVLSTVSNLDTREISTDVLDITLLSLCWFCIEASVRSGHRLSGGSSEPRDLNPVHASVRLILRYLIAYGLRKPYRIIRKNPVLDDTKMSCHAAQIWVCLLHLLPICDVQSLNDTSKENPLWSEILSHYQRTPSANAFETSESVWKVVFTLMAFSQFSVLGIVTSNTRLSASWSLVAYAIKQAQLVQGACNPPDFGQETLEKRDEYISIIIFRCYHILDYWKWKMDHSFGALNQLVDIFRARNFVNLRHEKPEFPDFMLNRDWTSLSQLRSATDSAFTSILKLFMRAVDSNYLTKAEIKKMVALIIPVSKFRTQKEAIPGVDDLSPICNRFAALALAIAVDSGYATRTVNQVHGSIDFAASDLSTQLLTIRGINLLASLMIQRDASLQEIAKWFTTTIGTAASEFKILKSPGSLVQGQRREQEDKIRKYSLLVLSLYAAGRIIMETFTAKSQYPDPAFLLAFKPFLEPEFVKVIEETNVNLCEMRRFLESFLEARNKYLPLPEPVLPNMRVDDPESQDYGDIDFGIDLNDPALLAQLEGRENSFATIRDKEKSGELLQKVIFPCFWVARRKIQRFCEATADSAVDHTILRTLDSWAHCLVGCMHILIQHGTLTDWEFCLKEITPLWRSVRPGWLKVRVQLVLYFEILRYNPTFYVSKSAEILELLFTSFAIHDITIEPKFWRLVISHEVVNPLFKDTPDILSLLDGGADSGSPDYKGIRTLLVRAIFGNIESVLQEAPKSSSQVATWVELCLKFLSAIRSISQDFMGKPDMILEYNAWSKEVLTLLETHPQLRHHQRLVVISDLLLQL